MARASPDRGSALRVTYIRVHHGRGVDASLMAVPRVFSVLVLFLPLLCKHGHPSTCINNPAFTSKEIVSSLLPLASFTAAFPSDHFCFAIERAEQPIQTQLKPRQNNGAKHTIHESEPTKRSINAAMSRSTQSTRSNPPKTLKWLFFNPANEMSESNVLEIAGYSLGRELQVFDWAAELKRHHQFRAGKVHFWRVCCRSISFCFTSKLFH